MGECVLCGNRTVVGDRDGYYKSWCGECIERNRGGMGI